MRRGQTLVLTALVPCIWGGTFVVTTELLPDSGSFANASIRALVAGILLLAVTREFPRREWLWKITIAGALNFSIFWWLLFEAAYRLPGGVAATVGAIQPLFVGVLAVWLLNAKLDWRTYVAACCGITGVGMLAITPEARFDPFGLIAAIGGALSMAMGVVLTKRWQMQVSPLSFAAWQLVIGGTLLVPPALIFDTPFPAITIDGFLGYLFLGVIGGVVTYAIWFKGLAQLGPVIPTTLGFFSPMTAMLLGWLILGQTLTPLQVLGAVVVLVSVISAVWLQSMDGRSAERHHNAKADFPLARQGPASTVHRCFLQDPFSHPDIRRMTARKLSDLPINPRDIPPE